ncbi:FAD/NAD(P)-binding domain-containing protein [Macrolepiota fuliginosa MF-IS2]|uniref:FAD/NAD(P)-binding domain-containing protein n=1 Tax=Macrolepiota fuliginosa MF-IS2 TaxID=1400762 RepID=A0A9P6BX32_9AGAR|nr:FAD/NAD(P)-binding domain-containing protein [Macrolepiota fuliginosa MF-IS2]
MSSSNRAEPLKIAIAGGGLGGLAAAATLRRQGHIVEIFEASATNAELGLGIGLPPNGAKILESIGFRRENVKPIEWKQAMVISQRSQVPFPSDMEYFVQAYGRLWDACTRSALHTELKRLAFDKESQNPPCKIHLATPVISCDPETGKITYGEGKTSQFDLVIGADGVKSRVRPSINPDPSATPLMTGLCTYRFTLDKHLLESIPGVEWVMHEGPQGPRIWIADNHRHVFAYAINCPQRGEIFGLNLMCKDTRDQSQAKWRVDVPREEMLARFSDFDEALARMLELAPPMVTLWQLRVLEPQHTWSKGKACLLGDAAHAMFQVLGQGAAQSFEDAFLLGELLPLGTPTSAIPGILKRYEDIRKPRAHLVQTISYEDAVIPEKRGRYMRSLDLQIPVMGYDAVHELGRCKLDSILVSGGAEPTEGIVSPCPLVNQDLGQGFGLVVN